MNNTSATVLPLRQQLLGGLRNPLLALMIDAGFLLVVGCINVASLMLVRGARWIP